MRLDMELRVMGLVRQRDRLVVDEAVDVTDADALGRPQLAEGSDVQSIILALLFAVGGVVGCRGEHVGPVREVLLDLGAAALGRRLGGAGRADEPFLSAAGPGGSARRSPAHLVQRNLVLQLLLVHVDDGAVSACLHQVVLDSRAELVENLRRRRQNG